MPSCCYGDDYGAVFTPGDAEDNVRRFREKGLTGTASELVAALAPRVPPGGTVLEVGGGAGEIQVALLEAGAGRAVNVELSPSWEEAARALLEERSLTYRVERVGGDFVELAGGLPLADVVIMHKVVCCYPDWRTMLAAAASKTRRLLGLTFPAERWWTRAGLRLVNLFMWARRLSFRAYVHPEAAMIDYLTAAGLAVIHDHTGTLWRTVVLERS